MQASAQAAMEQSRLDATAAANAARAEQEALRIANAAAADAREESASLMRDRDAALAANTSLRSELDGQQRAVGELQTKLERARAAAALAVRRPRSKDYPANSTADDSDDPRGVPALPQRRTRARVARRPADAEAGAAAAGMAALLKQVQLGSKRLEELFTVRAGGHWRRVAAIQHCHCMSCTDAAALTRLR